MMTILKFVSFVAISGMAACGGTTVPVLTDLPPLEETAGTTGVSFALDGANLAVKTLNATHVLAPTPGLDVGTFSAYQNAMFDSGAMRSESPNSIASVGFINPTTDQVNAATYTRNAGTALPTTGTATLNGDYAAYMVGTTGYFFSRVTGNVTLNATFDATPTVSGAITNRVGRGLFVNTINGLVLSDVIFPETPITSTGSFSVSGTGGSIGTPANSPLVEGLFAGAAGSEAVGAVTVSHSDTGASLIERGAFAAGH